MSIYYPVLRWKQGERTALQNLSANIKSQVCPIIEFPLDCEHDDKKVIDFCQRAVNNWGTEQPFYLDLSHIDYTNALAEDEHPALSIFRESDALGLLLIPVINTDADPELLSVIYQALGEDLFKNVALRINENDDDSSINDEIAQIYSSGVAPSRLDLIIDMLDVSSGAIQAKIRILSALINQIGCQHRDTIVISGSFPGRLDEYVGTDDSAFIPRYDWQLWNRARDSANLARIKFGDYTTIPCEFREVPFRGAPKIKYTRDNDWYVIKGHRQRGRDNQRQSQAQKIIGSEFYRGADYSLGDNRIHACANGDWGPGNPANWVAIDVSQHITYVVSQLSSTPGVI